MLKVGDTVSVWVQKPELYTNTFRNHVEGKKGSIVEINRENPTYYLIRFNKPIKPLYKHGLEFTGFWIHENDVFLNSKGE